MSMSLWNQPARKENIMFAKLTFALIATLIALPAFAGQQFGRDSVYADRQASAPAINTAATANVLGRDSVYAFGTKATTPITVAVSTKPGRA
jgi:uncharacterized membrane protein YfbV (UPF0208 family)